MYKMLTLLVNFFAVYTHIVHTNLFCHKSKFFPLLIADIAVTSAPYKNTVKCFN